MGALRDHFLNLYPYTDFHELNADWLIKVLMKMVDEVENFVAQNAIKYADPIQWNITRQYEKNTIVVDPITGTAYISNHPVPMGVALSNTHYWSVVFDLGRFITLASQNFANTYEAVTTTTATQPTNEGDWVVWDSILYQAKNDIHVGDAYVIDGNIEKKTVEDFFNELKSSLANEAQTRADEDARVELELSDLITSKVGIEAQARADEDVRIQLELTDLITSKVGIEAQTRADEDAILLNQIGNVNNKIGVLADLTTRNKLNVVGAINELDSDFPYLNFKDYGGVGDGVTDNYDALMDAITDMQAKEIPLFIPAGTYLINSPVFVPVGFCQIIGAGMKSTIIKYNNTDTLFTLEATSFPTYHDIVFKDMYFVTTQIAHCFNIKYVNGGLFENLYIRGFRNSITAELAWCINVVNVRASHSPDAFLDAHFHLKHQCNAWNFIGCFSSLDGSLGTNIHVLLRGDMSNVNFYGCVFEYGEGIMCINVDPVAPLQHININGCYFEWMEGNCFRNYNTSSLVQNVKISNCLFNAKLDGLLQNHYSAIDAPQVDGIMVDTCYQLRYTQAMITHARGSAINYDYRCCKTDTISIPVLSDGVLVDEGQGAPATGYHQQGYFRRNTKPTGATPVIGWVCTAAGTPGTWVAVTAN